MFWYSKETPVYVLWIDSPLKHVQNFDACNSNQKKEKEKRKKIFSLQL